LISLHAVICVQYILHLYLSVATVQSIYSPLVSKRTNRSATLQMDRVIRLTMTRRASSVVKSILIKRGESWYCVAVIQLSAAPVAPSENEWSETDL